MAHKQSAAIDHLALSESLGYHIFRKKKRRSWTPQEDVALKHAVIEHWLAKQGLAKYANEDIDVEEVDWVLVSTQLGSLRKPKECRKRWTSSLNPCLRKGKWTAQEDALLIEAYKKYGSAWQKVSAEIEGRNEDQCSKRYTEVLNTDTKDRLKPWTRTEDLELITGVRKYGTKWRTISKTISGRPSLTCRNRWRRIMTDVAKSNASEEIMKAVGVLDVNGKPLYTFDSKGQAHKEREGGSGGEGNDTNVGVNSSIPPMPTTTTFIPSNSYSPSESSTSSQPAPNANPTRSYTNWRFALHDPRTNEELTQFSGPIASQDLAHQLIDLARYNGLNLTIHQHIHHHYSPSSPVLEPQASVARFSHFNYLPPLTEVPKLTSSNRGSPTGTPSSSLMRLLNGREEAAPQISPAAPQFANISTPPNMVNGTTTTSPRRQQLAASSASSTGSAEKPKRSVYDLDEEEGDFWETLRSIAQPKQGQSAQTAQNGQSGQEIAQNSTAPVSQHHPLHYDAESPVAARPDDDQYGLYYNVFENRRDKKGDGYGFVMPFNPS